jgi:uncharacterized membrane protein YgdD (TMEM256/DUF423 family)
LSRNFIFIAAILGFLGVALGAFGTHGLTPTLEANSRVDTFETATRYHLYHALALLVVGLLEQYRPSRWTRRAGYLFIVGVIVFSGSLYVLAIFNLRAMGAVAPVGGAALLGGWALLAYSAWRNAD